MPALTESNNKTESQATANAPATPPATPPATDAKSETAKPETAKPETTKAADKPKVPESYSFSVSPGLPEGFTFDEDVIGAFSGVARELQMSQEGAQKLLDTVIPVLHRRGIEQQQATRTEWIEASKVDKEFGGPKLQENLAVAKKGLDRFGTPAMRDLLDGHLGLGDHPEFVRLFYRLGKLVGEDKFVGGAAAKPSFDVNDDAAVAKALYPKSN